MNPITRFPGTDTIPPLSPHASNVHREAPYSALHRAEAPRSSPSPVEVGHVLRSLAGPALDRGLAAARTHLPKLIAKHPMGAAAAMFAIGLITGRVVLRK